jgi:hypothetical protein
MALIQAAAQVLGKPAMRMGQTCELGSSEMGPGSSQWSPSIMMGETARQPSLY